jgi:Tfp pilus assembly protein PilV
MRARGYILMEVMVGGLMASVVLAGALTFMAQARQQTTRGARAQTAASMLQESVERFHVLPFGDLDAASFPAAETVSTPGGGSYSRTHTLTPGSQTIVGAAVNTMRLDVRVEFTIGGNTVATRATTTRFQ